MTRTREAVVIGGGYAGVVAANRLSTSAELSVTLINPRPDFVERIRLHQRATGSYGATVPYADVLAPSIRLTVDSVTRIDAPSRSLVLDSGTVARYDHLVYAVGSHAATPEVPGAAEHAIALSTLEQADDLRVALSAVPTRAPVTVVGGGSTGIEIAAELAELGRPVTLLAGDRLAPSLHPAARATVVRQLDRLGATVLAGAGARAAAVDTGGVRLADGRELPSALTVWTAGFGVPDLARRSGLRTDHLGRLVTDETLTSLDDERIVAAGDCAAPSGMPYRMCCAAAQPLGAQAADTVLRRIAGDAPRGRSLAIPGQCLSLGRRAGVLQFARRDDTALPAHLGGRLGAGLKEAVTAGTLVGLRTMSRRPGIIGALGLLQDPRRAGHLAAASTDLAPVQDRPSLAD
ncbi:pyridine nucleotide-disulfide oxidoreductase [Brachybacterium sp. P6-10-X1]|uniref:NAD(P)/FAD-dependent oxidoreductase n=1 Tax=Brachybacterium sp. P6-10-X1 TaxID=1903186 RepID=UPI00097199FA|nr:FAD-dependent oxidoreductase [Brachybacterium sp. P6-10-X1]APX32682.1 pyridine nucleotide-disulfide oxidoreductase [Brachybacterium sp. P6-10-X1]